MGGKLLTLDFRAKRVYIWRKHWHHGATGTLILLASQRLHGRTRQIGQTIGIVLMIHDKVDWPWFGVD